MKGDMLLGDNFHLFAFNLFLGLILGSVFYRADFCIAGMFRDVFLFRNYSMMRSLFLYLAVMMLLFFVMRQSGIAVFDRPPNYKHPSLATLTGGFVFGIGMVLAGGCVVGTLYKMASGKLASLIAFFGIIAGSLIYAEFHPIAESFRKSTIFTDYIFISDFSTGAETSIIVIISILSLLVFSQWSRQGKFGGEAFAEGYLNPWKAALIIALLNLASFLFSGLPMGISTAYAKMGAFLENLLIPSHSENLLYFTQYSVSAILPSGLSIAGGAGPRLDLIFFTEVALATGIVAGAFSTALRFKEFNVYSFPPRRQAVSAFIGGLFMAFGGRIAAGCNFKFLLAALPFLALQGIVFVTGMIGGAYFGTVILKRIVIQSAMEGTND
jgi:uncharacterized protein